MPEVLEQKTSDRVSSDMGFWYESSNGLVEIAVNQGRADSILGISVGNEVKIIQ